MSTQTVRSIIRLVAVVTILVGGIGVSTSMIASLAMRELMQSASEGLNVQHSVTSVGFYGVLCWLAVLGWGVALYQLSPGIARHITSEPETKGLQSPSVRGEISRS